MEKATPETLTTFFITLFIFEVAYPLAIAFSKWSILALYWRIFHVKYSFKITLIFTTLLTGAWLIVSVSDLLFINRHFYYKDSNLKKPKTSFGHMKCVLTECRRFLLPSSAAALYKHFGRSNSKPRELNALSAALSPLVRALQILPSMSFS